MDVGPLLAAIACTSPARRGVRPTEPLVTTTVGWRALRDEVRCLSTLSRVDFADLHTLRTAAAGRGSPEDWARAILERAPRSRHSPYGFWRLLGLRLGPRSSPDHVQGWRVAARGADWIRLEAASWYMTAEALVRVSEDEVCVSLFLRHDRPIAAMIWAPVSPLHRRGVPVMLRQALAVREAGAGR